MLFEQKKIGDDDKQKEMKFSGTFKKVALKRQVKKRSFVRTFLLIFLLLFSVYFIFSVLWSIYAYGNTSKWLQSFFTPVMVELEKDENQYVNILLSGIGGDGHDGGDLTDTMIVASIDMKNENIMMLSIPRDLWVTTTKFGQSRINEIYRNVKNRLEQQFDMKEEVAKVQSMKILMREIENITGLEIPYYARIDFNGFTEIVDAIDGIEVDVRETIVDEKYPDGKWGYETFMIQKGTRVLDGVTALKYARSRHGTSDFDRARRQQEIINAIKEKALSLDLITSPRKLKKLHSIVKNHFETNMLFQESFTLASNAMSFNKSSLITSVLNDDLGTRGGFLATPPRVDYGGAFVLIPYSGVNDYSRIQIFTNFLFNNRELQFMNFEVLNGTKRPGRAGKAATRLERYGINISTVGNTKEGEEYAESELWVYKDLAVFENVLADLQKIFPVKIVNKVGFYEETEVAATFVIGKDFK